MTICFMENYVLNLCKGVRALLIDKDNQPKWTPDSLAGVTDTRVNYYFAEFDNPKDELNL